MGTDEEYTKAYVTAVPRALQEEYPTATIHVDAESSFINSSQSVSTRTRKPRLWQNASRKSPIRSGIREFADPKQ